MRPGGEFDKVVAAAARGSASSACGALIFPLEWKRPRDAPARGRAMSRDVDAADSAIPIRMPNSALRQAQRGHRRICPYPPSLSDALPVTGDSVAERPSEFDKLMREPLVQCSHQFELARRINDGIDFQIQSANMAS
ncbi:hypothetical protein [Burkholderia thailandensis]|uniref:hypothetical protein n=1 Tax=Burkholderia thailandensis TaxID=57975 RepID=UPI001F003E63|nr:hypothetical protein [Burkholderia thailandensis]